MRAVRHLSPESAIMLIPDDLSLPVSISRPCSPSIWCRMPAGIGRRSVCGGFDCAGNECPLIGLQNAGNSLFATRWNSLLVSRDQTERERHLFVYLRPKFDLEKVRAFVVLVAVNEAVG